MNLPFAFVPQTWRTATRTWWKWASSCRVWTSCTGRIQHLPSMPSRSARSLRCLHCGVFLLPSLLLSLKLTVGCCLVLVASATFQGTEVVTLLCSFPSLVWEALFSVLSLLFWNKGYSFWKSQKGKKISQEVAVQSYWQRHYRNAAGNRCFPCSPGRMLGAAGTPMGFSAVVLANSLCREKFNHFDFLVATISM